MLKPLFLKPLTCLGHALGALHARVEHLFGGDEEDVVGSLVALHHLQLLDQEVHTAVCVLLPHLEAQRTRVSHWLKPSAR